MSKRERTTMTVSAAALAEAVKLRIPTPPCGSRHPSDKDYSRRAKKKELRRTLSSSEES